MRAYTQHGEVKVAVAMARIRPVDNRSLMRTGSGISGRAPSSVAQTPDRQRRALRRRALHACAERSNRGPDRSSLIGPSEGHVVGGAFFGLSDEGAEEPG